MPSLLSGSKSKSFQALLLPFSILVATACASTDDAHALPEMPGDRDYPCSQAWDDNGDGSIDRRKFFEYAADGRVLWDAEDTDADGRIDRHDEYFFDSEGREVGSRIYNNDDGFIDVVATITWEADTATVAYDYYNDRSIDFTVVYRLNAAGDSVEVRSFDAAGKLVNKHEYTRDADGNATKDVYEDFEQPTNNYTTTWAYDADGNLLSAEVDENSDGSVTYSITHELDETGLARRSVQESSDGTILSESVYAYDDSGRLVTMTEDEGADGTIDSTQNFTFECWR